MNMMGDYSVLPSNKSSSSPVNPDFQGSSSTSVPPCPQGLLTSQGPPRSQDSISDLRKQLRKRTVFSQEQKLVLQEHFDECMHPSQEQCMALAQRLDLKESHIKIWFKNRRAKQNRKNSQEVPGEPGSGSHDRPACPQGSVPLGTSASADSLRQSPELQNHPSTISEPSQQMSQSPLSPPGVLMQSSLQRHSDHERIPHPHVSPDPSMKPSPQLLGTGTAYPRHQVPLRSSVSSGCKGSQVPIASSDKCDDQQFHHEAPRKQRKERTIYSKEQKFLLQRHFDQDKHPSIQKLMELAQMIGVTEYEIKFSNLQRSPTGNKFSYDPKISSSPGFSIGTWSKNDWNPNVHQSYKSSSTAVNRVFKGSSSTSRPPYPQDSQAPPRTHISPNDARRQQKRTVFTKEQKLVLEAHFDKGRYLDQKECKELSEMLGLKEYDFSPDTLSSSLMVSPPEAICTIPQMPACLVPLHYCDYLAE